MITAPDVFAIRVASVSASGACNSSRSEANFGQGELDLPATFGDNFPGPTSV
jgi:hypothetical protein